MRWWISLIVVLWVAPAVAQEWWENLPPDQILFHQEVLTASAAEIRDMPADEFEAFRRMLAACGSGAGVTSNEAVAATCDQAANYFSLLHIKGGAVSRLLAACRFAWFKARTAPNGTLAGEISRQLGAAIKVWTAWEGTARTRRKIELSGSSK